MTTAAAAFTLRPVGPSAKKPMLRNMNYHFRFTVLDAAGNEIVDSRGGVTVVYRIKDGNIYMGSSVCSPLDNYCKKTGRIIADNRAMAKDPVSDTPLTPQQARVLAYGIALRDLCGVLIRLLQKGKITPTQFDSFINSFTAKYLSI